MPVDAPCLAIFHAKGSSTAIEPLCRESSGARHFMSMEVLCLETFYGVGSSVSRDIFDGSSYVVDGFKIILCHGELRF